MAMKRSHWRRLDDFTGSVKAGVYVRFRSNKRLVQQLRDLPRVIDSRGGIYRGRELAVNWNEALKAWSVHNSVIERVMKIIAQRFEPCPLCRRGKRCSAWPTWSYRKRKSNPRDPQWSDIHGHYGEAPGQDEVHDGVPFFGSSDDNEARSRSSAESVGNIIHALFEAFMNSPWSQARQQQPRAQPVWYYPDRIGQYAKILNLSWPASKEQINQAAKRLAMEHHPDKGGDEEKMKEILAARDQLLAVAHG